MLDKVWGESRGWSCDVGVFLRDEVVTSCVDFTIHVERRELAWFLAVTGQIWPEMTTWRDICDLPKWPGLTRIRVEKRAASFNTTAGTSL